MELTAEFATFAARRQILLKLCNLRVDETSRELLNLFYCSRIFQIIGLIDDSSVEHVGNILLKINCMKFGITYNLYYIFIESSVLLIGAHSLDSMTKGKFYEEMWIT